MKKIIIFFTVISIFSFLNSTVINFTDSWNNQGLNLISASKTELVIEYSIHEVGLEEIEVNGSKMIKPILTGSFLPNDEGMPDLPGFGRYFAIPMGARVELEILSSRKKIIKDIDIAPAFRIPLDTETGSLEYSKNKEVYATDSFYPETPIQLSEITKIRGVDAAILGITPFQYNPVTKELVIYKDIRIRISFKGSSGKFGEDRLQNIWWDNILSDVFLNYSSLPTYQQTISNNRTEDYDYIIITPDDPIFTVWADSLSIFRNEQGIRTGVVTTTEIGGNTVTAIEGYINDAYNNWDVPPSAVLLLGDYGTTGSSIVSPIWNNYCVSDNIYADVNNNNMPDVVLARMTAQNEDQLSIMIGKVLDYERNPSTNQDFYDHPVTALGWQTERWFQICSESVGGFWQNVLGKDQVRINAIYAGNPNVDPWSTATNTSTVLNVFGPNGLNYIPASPSELGGWSGGNAIDINNAINSGAFMLQHRDHGGVTGWGEPDYDTGNLSGLNNDDLVFVFSINCLTGKYNAQENSFAELFHRHEHGALGLIAASEVSYSFVNDTFVWGMYDNMWKNFLPQFGGAPSESDWIRPAFANAAGKYFLQQSSWPYNENNKEVTYNLFHHHGCAFSTVHSEMPQQLNVSHADELMSGLETFEVTADEGALIGLSVDGELIASVLGTGVPLQIDIPQQAPNNIMKVTVTKQNYYRYSEEVTIISPDMYVICNNVDYIELGIHAEDSYQSLDTLQIDLTLQNIGMQPTGNTVTAVLTTDSDKIVIINETMSGAQIPASSNMTYTNAFSIELLPLIDDNSTIEFEVEVSSSGESWISGFELNCNAPVIEYWDYSLNVLNGTDQILDPGENGEIFLSFHNIGNGFAYDTQNLLYISDPYISISGLDIITSIAPDSIETTTTPFIINVDENSPVEYFVDIDVYVIDSSEFIFQSILRLPIGFYAFDFENGETGWEHMVLSEGFIDEWHWDDFRNNTVDGNYSMKCGGIGTTYYSNLIYAALVMPEIDVFPGAQVTFHHWMDVGSNGPITWDGGLIEISVNGGEWEQIEPLGGYPSVTMNNPASPFEEGTEVFAGEFDWEEVTLDLSAYSGTAQIRFVFGSANLITGEGWYIDDIYYSNTTGSNDNTIIPIMNKLNSNFPNPFNPTTTISFSLKETGNVKIEIFNIRGQKVKTLTNGLLPAKNHQIVWNGKDDKGKSVSSGIYFYKMRSANYTASRKMILMK
ncbi:MAG: T9SS type A sorting domain-containing protein [Candidatus Cloacimonetes bacterium]|nr:T9SS type A sorting domain-containing protein [Candidatus Cloacimonadota bacterium]